LVAVVHLNVSQNVQQNVHLSAQLSAQLSERLKTQKVRSVACLRPTQKVSAPQAINLK
jgi:hypothetical protein